VIPRRWVEAYLRFLLRRRLAVALVTAVLTVFFAWQCTHIRVLPQFLDFYPSTAKITVFGHELTWRRGHPYIDIYNDFRRMFGSANILTVILEKKQGDIYNPTTLRKIDQMTRFLVKTRGVVPNQVMSIAHPNMKSISAWGDAIQVREVY
jgi:predicted RND superfamily exporter protein